MAYKITKHFRASIVFRTEIQHCFPPVPIEETEPLQKMNTLKLYFTVRSKKGCCTKGKKKSSITNQVTF